MSRAVKKVHRVTRGTNYEQRYSKSTASGRVLRRYRARQIREVRGRTGHHPHGLRALRSAVKKASI